MAHSHHLLGENNGIVDWINQHIITPYIYSKEWSIYPFIPPIFSLFLSIFIAPIYENLLGEKEKNFLAPLQLDSEKVEGIIKDRGLQAAYMTEVPAFFISVITLIKSDFPSLLIILIIGVFLFAMIILPVIYFRAPAFHATTKFPQSGRPNFLAKRNWTYFGFYSRLLIILNLLIIFIIYLTLPPA